MSFIEKLKGVFKKFMPTKNVQELLQIAPAISSEMKNAIELWENMYKNQSPWLSENVHSLGLAPMIASEKARLATVEMEIKVTGDSEKAEFMDECLKKLVWSIRKNLEYGIALGSLVIKPYITKMPDGTYNIEFNFTKATDFYPLSFSTEGNVIEAAFIDRIIDKEYVYSKVEYHKLEGSSVIVKNMAFRTEYQTSCNTITPTYPTQLGTPVLLTEVPAWASLEPEIILNQVNTMMFAYFKMPQANNIDLSSPLGVSGFSRAVGLIKNADEQYSNLLWEFEGGQLAIDVDRTALNPLKDKNGNLKEALPKLQNRLYRRDLDLGDDEAYNVFSPQLRDVSILNGLNAILQRIEDVCEVSRGTISQPEYAEARTATELKILKQRSYAANCDIQKALEMSIRSVVNILDIYCTLYNICPEGDYEVAYKWDDSIIVDKDAERQVDLLDINAGLLSKIEYRMKWMGETRVQAEQALKDIRQERMDDMKINQLFSLGMQTEAQASHDKLVRSNESVETTTNNEEADK